MGDTAGYERADLSKHLRPEEITALDDRSPQSAQWENWSRYYQRYYQAVHALLGEHRSAFNFIGTIDKDWRGLGYAHRMGRIDLPPTNYELPLEGENLRLENFGARVFLTANEKLAELPGLWLIDFDQPDIQRIPVIDAPPR